jgi:hypothetical protein
MPRGKQRREAEGDRTQAPEWCCLEPPSRLECITWPVPPRISVAARASQK